MAETAPDLVVLDINMPKLDGLKVCRRLRATSDLPILFTTRCLRMIAYGLISIILALYLEAIGHKDRIGLFISLTLPGTELVSGSGASQRRAALTALALFPRESAP